MAKKCVKVFWMPKCTRHTHSFALDALGLMIRVSEPEIYFVCSSESCTETVVKNNYQQLCCTFLCLLNSDMVAVLLWCIQYYCRNGIEIHGSTAVMRLELTVFLS